MKPTVALVKVENHNIDKAVYEAIQTAGGLEEQIRPDTRILVKPNLCGPHPSGSGCVTDARVTRAVTRFVLECGGRSVVIGEGAGAGYDFSGSHSTEECFRVSGTQEIARALKVELRNLNADTPVEVPVRGGYVMDTVKIAKTAYESDLIISVPVFKTHKRTVVTLSLKNMKGVMPGAEKRKTHSLGLDLGIADLVSVCTPRFVVADGVVGLGGTWNYPEDSVNLGLVMASADPIVADTAGTHVMGFHPQRVMHLQYYARRLGHPLGLSKVTVRGEPVEGWPRFRDAFHAFRERFPDVRILEGKAACSGCSGELGGALSYVHLAGFVGRLKGLTIIMGCPLKVEEAELNRDRIFYLGKCCREASRQAVDAEPHRTIRGIRSVGGAVFAAGCPPKDEAIIRALALLCGFDGKAVLSLRDSERKRLWESTARLLSV
jgi:uncharacterized protein (DUF362 family)